MAFLILAACLLVIAALYLMTKRSKKLAFPGPKGLPFFGSYFYLRGKQMHTVLLEWHAEFGGVFTFTIFGRQYLVVGSPDALQQALVTRGNDFAGRPPRYRINVLTDNCQNILSSGNLHLNKALRGVTQNVLNAYGRGRGRLEAILDAAVDDLIDKFGKKGGKPFDPTDELYEATSQVVYTMLTGHQPEDLAGVAKLMQESVQIFDSIGRSTVGNMLLDVIPAMRFLPWFSPYKSLMDCMKRLGVLCDKLVWPMLEKCKTSEHPSIGKTLLDSIGQPYGQGQDTLGHISMLNAKHVILDLINAGNVTTSTTMYAMLGILQCKPQLQEMMAKEIDAVIGRDGRVTLDHKERMPYTRAVIFEVLRYSTAVALGIPHMARVDTELCGTPVHAGTYVINNLWACHHNTKYWDDPWTFKAERFLDADGHLVPADHRNRRQLFAFGAGTRVCLGEILAMNRLFLFVANLVHKFQFVSPEGTNSTSCDAREYKFGGVIRPPAFKLRAIPRQFQ